ncbi:MAG: response regulator transcription factor [Campylobacteraceae bacterium]|jgi:DNA-binding response OmpR family regulator|nr:response regulator transcription factor [Campylobacteraceae bacterium]
MKILLAEDDYIYNESIKEYLTFIGYSVDAFFDGESALDAILNKEYHVLLIDIKIPRLNGYKLMRYLKEINIKTPVIIITALVDINSIIAGYKLGCSDYLKKPFELKELELRIDEIIKKTQHVSSESIVQIDAQTVFNFDMDKLQSDGRDITLTPKELSIVRFLIYKKNRFCSTKLLKENIWKNKEVSSADIRMHIKKIRSKTHKNFIKSSKGLGYKIDVITQ